MLLQEEVCNEYTTSINNVNFVFNSKCNKKCDYCVAMAPYSTSRELSNTVIDRIYKYFDYTYKKLIDNNFTIGISGGEPGLLPDDLLDYILQNKFDVINTNGTILKNNIFIKNIKNIKRISYHISPEFKRDMYIEKLPHNVTYLIVVHHRNISILQEFLDLNNHIDFDIQLNLANFFNSIKHLRCILLDSDYPAIIKIIENTKNIEPVSKKRILDSYYKNNTFKNLCRYKKNLVIDFSTNSIVPCIDCEYTPFLFNKITTEIIDYCIDTKQESIISEEQCATCQEFLNSINEF